MLWSMRRRMLRGNSFLAHHALTASRVTASRVTASRLAAGCLMTGCLLAGCGGPAGQGQAVWSTRSGGPTGSRSASADATVASGRGSSATGAPQELTLAFAGDTHFTERTATLLRSPKTAFGSAAGLLSAADLTVLNLETSVTDRGTPEPKTFHFRAPSTAFTALRAAGVDAVTLANNHTLDYGQVGLADTLAAAASANFPVFGAGRDVAAAYAPWTTEVRGTRIAILGFSQVQELASAWAATPTRPGIAMAWDVDRAVAAVTAARAHADLVIVFNHWGEERVGCPNSDQRTFADRVAAAGADIIVGSHAHTLQGDGFLKQAYVAYGLGNFLWYSSSGSTDTGVLRLTVRGRSVIKHDLLPAVVSQTGQPVPASGAAAAEKTKHFTGLRACTGLADHSAS
jgi:Bacterial capsule synthesis protein PGA_cap